MTFRECFRALNRPGASVLLIVLLCCDLAFVVLHFANVLSPQLRNPLFNIECDRGYAEAFQYAKYSLILVSLVLTAWKNRVWRYVSWVLVLGYFLADDSLKLHEQLGALLAEKLDFIPPLGLRLQDFGELAVSASAGSLLLIAGVFAYRGGSADFKKTSKDLTLLILLLVFFGVVVDMVHSAIDMGRPIGLILEFVEGGGEMLSVSLLAWYSLLPIVRDGNANCYLCDFVRMTLKGRPA
ncbi:MAG: hypothetical protein L6Q31_10785 [Fimbriimonadaceae bacterium]|uniref:Uncharacterized protein n=1 Tax=Candidatus Nitrosymbiomonas proteolyticus TaxID=2608984 RepID=A0A809SEI1_9BACT|nr:hypothetical protein [Fimbriimonadaceae bacterium]NUM39616.1 hypothetical protein [Armatimonadota bacterium]BBO23934.1 conserved hypothetical protein [Candidatus Nitrosymbiomonas proteolyticus]